MDEKTAEMEPFEIIFKFENMEKDNSMPLLNSHFNPSVEFRSGRLHS